MNAPRHALPHVPRLLPAGGRGWRAAGRVARSGRLAQWRASSRGRVRGLAAAVRRATSRTARLAVRREGARGSRASAPPITWASTASRCCSILLTTLLTAISVLGSFRPSTERVRALLRHAARCLETAMLGTFVALDMLVFYIFWEAMLVPMYFLIGVWGGEQRIRAAIKFFLYTMAGSVLMLVAILWLYFLHHSATGIVLVRPARLRTSLPMPLGVQTWLFLAFALAFAIKVPMFPFHTWLPLAHVEAPTAGSVILAGVLLKMGTYGFLRFAMPLSPTPAALGRRLILCVSRDRHHLRRARGLGAARHEEARRLLVGEPPGLRHARHVGAQRRGALGLAAADGQPRHLDGRPVPARRRHLRAAPHAARSPTSAGCGRSCPGSRSCSSSSCLSSIALPGTNGFVGEFLVLLGAFKTQRWFAVAGGFRRDPLGRLHALHVPARDVRAGDPTGERRAARPALREWAVFVPLLVLDVLARHLPGAVPVARAAGARRHRTPDRELGPCCAAWPRPGPRFPSPRAGGDESQRHSAHGPVHDDRARRAGAPADLDPHRRRAARAHRGSVLGAPRRHAGARGPRSPG